MNVCPFHLRGVLKYQANSIDDTRTKDDQKEDVQNLVFQLHQQNFDVQQANVFVWYDAHMRAEVNHFQHCL